MEVSEALQQILGTDRRNPVFTIYRDSEKKRLHVYYGGELLEVVADDKEHIEYKLLLGRLHNAQVNAIRLHEIFGTDPKTMKKWGDALRRGDPEHLLRVLEGRKSRRKLTTEIRSYVEMRFPSIYEETQYRYLSRIQEEIERVFGKKLSGETLRPLLKGLKEKEKEKEEEKEEEKEKGEKIEECNCDCGREERVDREPEVSEREEIKDTEEGGIGGVDNRKELPELRSRKREELRVGHHLGVLLFSGPLLRLEEYVGKEEWLVKQWLSGLFLGAVNIEQSKLLDFDDLEVLLGQTLPFAHDQRVEMGRMAEPELIEQLLRFNAGEIGAGGCSDLYYDPHTKRYTGMQKVLKAWCPGVRGVGKALHMDFMHTSTGEPVYLEHADNYVDLRQRIMGTVGRFREILEIPEEKVLSLVVDRAIYSYEVFKGIMEDRRHHVITWEKGYKRGDWEAEEISGNFILERSRNNAADIRRYSFAYIDEKWEKDEGMRQLRVRATNPKGRTIEVGILTDDKKREAEEVIGLMFRRWIQENDFKYLDKHYGINEITSYSTVAYKRLKGRVEEKKMKNGAYKALEEERRQLRRKLGKKLVQEQRYPGKSPKRTKEIPDLTRRIEEVGEKLKRTEKEVSKLQYLIDQDYVRLDSRNKRLMDALRLIARNVFYKTFEPFKKMYDNYRDDHVIFRNLTHADGLIAERSDRVEVTLLPTVCYTPKLSRIVKRLLTQINEANPLMPDGSGRRLILKLGNKSGTKLALVSPEKPPF